jgi:hypothetical protein
MKNSIKGFLGLSAYIDKCLQDIYKEKGLALKKIIYDWAKIVGNDLANYTIPYKISLTRKNNISERVLHILVANSSFSSELYYMLDMILEKIAFYVGAGYITQLKLDLKPSFSLVHRSEEIVMTGKLPDIKIEGIEDSDLENSLGKLGQAIHTKQK